MLEYVEQVDSLNGIIGLIGPTNFLIVFGLYLIYEVYSPDVFPDTKFQKIITRFEGKVDSIQHNLGNRLDTIQDKQVASIQIIRAIASVENPSEEIDDAVVDDYLVQNGIDKNQFLLGKREDAPLDHLTDDDVHNLIDRLEQTEEERRANEVNGANDSTKTK